MTPQPNNWILTVSYMISFMFLALAFQNFWTALFFMMAFHVAVLSFREPEEEWMQVHDHELTYEDESEANPVPTDEAQSVPDDQA